MWFWFMWFSPHELWGVGTTWGGKTCGFGFHGVAKTTGGSLVRFLYQIGNPLSNLYVIFIAPGFVKIHVHKVY